jgi:L-rhamnose isomerase/sugar isomerase
MNSRSKRLESRLQEAARSDIWDARIDRRFIEHANADLATTHDEELASAAAILERRGFKFERILREASRFSVGLPSWGFRQGGTRFGRFPNKNEPQTLEQKLFAAALVNDLTAITPRASLHIPWDLPENVSATRKLAHQLGLEFGAMNSNTFEDHPAQQHSYKFGSLSHSDSAVRRQAIEHNIQCIKVGMALGSEALVIWLADGTNFPGQQNFRRALDRTIDSLENIYEMLPDKWRMLVEYKPFEPAFYSTVINDWGTALMVCQELGPQAEVLVDLGHHLPNTNIEQVVSRLASARRLGGFHFNDFKYADDDLSSGSIKPYQLFLIFNELVDAALDPRLKSSAPKFQPDHMIDQSTQHQRSNRRPDRKRARNS